VFRFLLVIVIMGSLAVLAQDRGDFVVAYENPNSQIQLEYARFLQQQRFLESLVENLNRTIALPYDIGIVAAPCGQANAYWAPEQKTLVVCYDLFEYMSETFRSSVNSERELLEKMLGAVEFIFYHELGHTLIDTFDIPYTGRQEDAVDQFSSILLLSQQKANSVLAGASFFGASSGDTPFWAEHSLDEQRFYDIACLVYGSDPQTYDGLLLREATFGFGGNGGILPKQRAARCPRNFKDIESSWNRLIDAYVPAIGGAAQPAISADTTPAAKVADVIKPNDYSESFSGRLTQGDQTLPEGQYFDIYEVDLVEGQEVTFELSSTEFDTYLVVTGPSNETYFNDDATIKVEGYLSRLTLPISRTGTYLIGVSSYQAGETGSYRVGMIKTDGVYDQTYVDALEANDERYQSGEFFDSYEYRFEAGQEVAIVLSSLEFDAYLIVTAPSGEEFVNDDFENQFGMARLDFEAKETGVYTIAATSYEAGETGAYQLAISDGKKAIDPQTGNLGASIGEGSMIGQLAQGDTVLADGSYVDYYTITLERGQELSVSALSADFDVYIGLIKPSGEILEANRSDDGTTASLSTRADEAGVWYVIVTSARPGQVGNYLVSIK
jgi:hypothetical protein